MAERPRLIGSIHRESLDHLMVFGEAHLRGVLKVYVSYYNEVRTYLEGCRIINTSGFGFEYGYRLNP